MTVVRALPQTALREATDRRLLEETIRQGRTTRAELADATGYSRPTVSEAVRRLVTAGLLDAAGLKETGRRGRIGTFYELGARAGWVLGLAVDQSGVRWRATDLAGRTLSENQRPPTTPGDAEGLTESLRAAVREAVGGDGPLRAVGVSIANPVDPATHETVPLAGSPFPEGLVSPVAMIGDSVTAPVLVDNDVNLAALAEHRASGAASFAYVYVGAGLGVGLYIGDQLIRGAHGLAGEIGYLPGTLSPTLAGDLTAGGLGRSDAPSNDVAAVLGLLDRATLGPSAAADGPAAGRPPAAADPQTAGEPPTVAGPTAPVDSATAAGDQRAVGQLIDVVGRAIISVAAVVDPELILLGGPVGTHPALLPRVRDMIADAFPGPTRIDRGALGEHAPLHGALQMAVEHALATAVAVASSPGPAPAEPRPRSTAGRASSPERDGPM